MKKVNYSRLVGRNSFLDIYKCPKRHIGLRPLEKTWKNELWA